MKLFTLMSKTIIAFSLLMSAISMADSLTIAGFGGALQTAQRTAYFKPFSKKTQVAIKEDTYLGGIAKIKAMAETHRVLWDVVQIDENDMIVACDEGLLEKISAKMLGIDKSIMQQAKSSACGTGTFVWSMVLSYDKNKLSVTPKNWADFWNVKKWPGKRGLRKQARMTLEIALLADGVAPENIYQVLATKAGVDRAFKKLDQLKPDIIWWDTGAQAPERLNSGDVVMTAAYNGRISDANKEGKNFAISWTNQLYGMGFWSIVKDSKNIETAKQFIQFATQANHQKNFTDQIPYGVTNVNVNPLINPEVLKNLPTSPENLISALSMNPDFWVDHEEELQERFTQWLSQ
ncbi:MAG: ABC transporter substrate-binding protein [Ostreibacterium sp.]